LICVDNDAEKLAALNAGAVPIHEKFLPELLQKHRGKRLNFSGSVHDAVRASAGHFHRPSEHRSRKPAKLTCRTWKLWSRELAHALAEAKDDYKIIVEKSTVPVYTNAWIHRVMEQNGAPQGSFDVASNPEFLREGSAVTDFLYPTASLPEPTKSAAPPSCVPSTNRSPAANIRSERTPSRGPTRHASRRRSSSPAPRARS